MADVVIINKVDTAEPDDVEKVKASILNANPDARIIEAESPVVVKGDVSQIKGKRVLVVEDGPTLTHGEMNYGAAYVAAKEHGAAEIIDPRPYAVGSIKEVYKKYTHLENILPAMGYGKTQMKELKETIEKIPCDLVLIGTPIDLARHLKFNKPSLRITYYLKERTTPNLKEIIEKVIKVKTKK
jgi:predicted GTPase